ncbi:MAG: hypothetical protein LBQ35_03815 [Spirochaetaceae bacterium]|jgi:predicted NUDIX family phosphoesterase|nr:hypothetical protein [Spirochaetaceae bacterium]
MEEVLVIPSSLVLAHRGNDAALVEAALRSYRFMRRDAAETDESCKQIIPYVYACYEDRCLLLERLSAQSETRLHGKLSLGLGGHINPGDLAGAGAGAGPNPVLAGLRRELAEEVLLEPAGEPEFRGVINDDSTAVGRVHVGFVYALRCRSPLFRVMETDKMKGAWVRADYIAAHYEALESWSQIVFDSWLAPQGKA